MALSRPDRRAASSMNGTRRSNSSARIWVWVCPVGQCVKPSTKLDAFSKSRRSSPSRGIESGSELAEKEQKKNKSVVGRVAAGLPLVAGGAASAGPKPPRGFLGEGDHPQ